MQHDPNRPEDVLKVDAERLAMGYETRISQTVAEVENSREPGLLT